MPCYLAAAERKCSFRCGLRRPNPIECLLSGTTTIQDMGIGPGIDGLFEALETSGLRAWAGLCLMDQGEGLPSGLRQDPQQALARCEALASRYESPRVRYLLNPRFILSCSEELW